MHCVTAGAGALFGVASKASADDAAANLLATVPGSCKMVDVPSLLRRDISMVMRYCCGDECVLGATVSVRR